MFTYYNMVIMGDEKCILILISFFLNYPVFLEFNGWACTGYWGFLFFFGMKDTAFALYCMGVLLFSLCFGAVVLLEIAIMAYCLVYFHVIFSTIIFSLFEHSR